MGDVNDFQPDFSGFNNLFPAFEELAKSILKFSDAIVTAYGIQTPIPDNVEDIVQQIMIDNNIWDAVNFDRLTPEQRWEYQKWVYGATVRWTRERVESMRERWGD